MNIGNSLFLEQRLSLSLNQIQSLEILGLDALELKNLLKKEYLENPMFDCKNTEGTDASVSTVTYTHNLGEVITSENRFGDDIPMPEEGQIRKFLLEQIPEPDEETQYIAEYLIDCLDETGFFTLTTNEVSLGCGHPVSEVERVLRILEELEPCGIFMPDLRRCLMKQLERKEKTESDAYIVLRDHYQELMDGKISSITRSTKFSTSRVRACLEEIAALNPKPMQGFSNGENHYIEPDIILEYKEPGWNVVLNDDWIENYTISDHYVRMMNETQDEELREYFQKRLEHARMLINSIAQRRKTVIRITEAAVHHQSDFFESRGRKKPMTMTDLADELGISTSTVSRAVRGKYLQYPQGVISMKDLFTQKVSVDGEQVSVDGIRYEISNIIANEDKKRPLGDQAIADILKEKGISISRRAVTKYRNELNIKGSFERKE